MIRFFLPLNAVIMAETPVVHARSKASSTLGSSETPASLADPTPPSLPPMTPVNGDVIDGLDQSESVSLASRDAPADARHPPTPGSESSHLDQAGDDVHPSTSNIASDLAACHGRGKGVDGVVGDALVSAGASEQTSGTPLLTGLSSRPASSHDLSAVSHLNGSALPGSASEGDVHAEILSQDQNGVRVADAETNVPIAVSSSDPPPSPDAASPERAGSLDPLLPHGAARETLNDVMPANQWDGGEVACQEEVVDQPIEANEHDKSAMDVDGNATLPDASTSVASPATAEAEEAHLMSEGDYELTQMRKLVREMVSDHYKSSNWPFLDPVDVEALKLWDYPERVKKPMWLKKSKQRVHCLKSLCVKHDPISSSI